MELTISFQRCANLLCVHHELHEYDQDEDSSKACVPPVLLSHDVFTFRKVLVAIERWVVSFRERISGCS
jgi:hypothetical protein